MAHCKYVYKLTQRNNIGKNMISKEMTLLYKTSERFKYVIWLEKDWVEKLL